MAGTKFEITLEASRVLAMVAGLEDKALWKRALRSVVAIFGFKDIVDHFRKQEGPGGRWPALAEGYGKWKRKKYPGRPMLVLSGRLRQSFLPGNIRDVDDSAVSMFNPVEYSGKHDRGEDGVPERKFMWISRRAQDLMDKALVSTIIKGG